MTAKTTKFKGDIQFVNANETILCSDLIRETEADAKYALKSEIGDTDLSEYYTSTQCDDKFAGKCPVMIVTDAVYLNDMMTMRFRFKPGDKVQLAENAEMKDGSDGNFDWTGIIPNSDGGLSLQVSENVTLSFDRNGDPWSFNSAQLSQPYRTVNWTNTKY